MLTDATLTLALTKEREGERERERGRGRGGEGGRGRGRGKGRERERERKELIKRIYKCTCLHTLLCTCKFHCTLHDMCKSRKRRQPHT